jgi:hypothetical protein
MSHNQIKGNSSRLLNQNTSLASIQLPALQGTDRQLARNFLAQMTTNDTSNQQYTGVAGGLAKGLTSHRSSNSNLLNLQRSPGASGIKSEDY